MNVKFDRNCAQEEIHEFDLNGKESKNKNKWVEIYQTKKLLHSKINWQQPKKATNQMGKDVCNQHTW